MTVAALIRAVVFPDTDKSAAASAFLKPGDTLAGKIVEIADNGKVLIDFGKLRVMADTDLNFHAGQKIRVRVEETGRQIKLKHLISSRPEAFTARGLPDAAGSPLDRLFAPLLEAIDRAVHADRQAAGAERLPENVRLALTSIQNNLQPSLASLRPAELAVLLKQLVENAGFFFEKRLERLLGQPGGSAADRTLSSEGELSRIGRLFKSDLKPNLAIVKNHLESTSDRSLSALSNADDLKTAVDRLLSGIERQQHQFRSHPAGAELPPAFTVPFHLTKTGQKGMLKVFGGLRSETAETDEFRISVLLHMDKIGDIRSDLLLRGKTLHVGFRVEDEDVRYRLQREMDRFTETLADQFASVRTKVRLHPNLRLEMEMQAAQVFSDRHIDVRV